MPRSKPKDHDKVTYLDRVKAAAAAVLRSGRKVSGRFTYSIRQAAKDFGVSDTTVNERLKGRRTHEEAAEDQQRLTPAQERVLVEWIKRCAARNMGLTTQSIIDAACRIAGCECGERWLRGFRERHKDELRGKWARGQEAPRAQSLNHANVDAFFELLRVLFEEYGIDAENLYNMDEKGLLLGLGAHTFVLVDRNADTVKVVEDGNRELVIIIECVCADGTSIRPGVIFKGARRDLEWGRNNPIDASISISPKGWTDTELDFEWLVNDFEPKTREKANGRHRMLIIDGHSSHLSYRFCDFAERHKIVVVCLPPHTTHALQPCDVGVFGPLASSWKSEVSKMSRDNEPICKTNLVSVYARCRGRAMRSITIQHAWQKTGIWPLNPAAIPETAYEPALITTTAPAQPIPTTTSALLRPFTPEPVAEFAQPTATTPVSASSALAPPVSAPTHAFIASSASYDAAPASAISLSPLALLAHAAAAEPRIPESILFTPIWLYSIRPPAPTSATPALPTVSPARFYPALVGTPTPIRGWASRDQLLEENVQLRAVLGQARHQIDADHAQKMLMDGENTRLRRIAYSKTIGKRSKKELPSGGPRHMTAGSTLDLLARKDLEEVAEAMREEVATKLKPMREALDADAETRRQAEKKRLVDLVKTAERAKRAAAKALVGAAKAAEKAAAKAVEDAERAAKKASAAAAKEVAKEATKVAAAIRREAKKAETKRRQAAKRAEAEAAKAAGAHAVRTRGRKRTAPDSDDDADDNDAPGSSPERRRSSPPPLDAVGQEDVGADGPAPLPVLAKRPRPRPRPAKRVAQPNGVTEGLEGVGMNVS